MFRITCFSASRQRCVCACKYTHMNTCICKHTCACVCLCVWTCLSRRVSVCVCVCVCVGVCACAIMRSFPWTLPAHTLTCPSRLWKCLPPRSSFQGLPRRAGCATPPRCSSWPTFPAPSLPPLGASLASDLAPCRKTKSTYQSGDKAKSNKYTHGHTCMHALHSRRNGGMTTVQGAKEVRAHETLS